MSTMHRSKGGVQSEISMWENRVFESRSAQCHAATSWIDGGGRGAGTTATSWNDGEELDRRRRAGSTPVRSGRRCSRKGVGVAWKI
jgi:hypothetical protein